MKAKNSMFSMLIYSASVFECGVVPGAR